MENLFHGRPELPELPVFGLRILMPTLAKEYRYEGLSGETYPDRKKGAHRGVFIEKPIMTPYLVPQECGMHMDTEWVEIYRDTIQDNSMPSPGKHMLKICKSGENFHFHVFHIRHVKSKMQLIRKSFRQQGELYCVFMERQEALEELIVGEPM